MVGLKRHPLIRYARAQCKIKTERLICQGLETSNPRDEVAVELRTLRPQVQLTVWGETPQDLASGGCPAEQWLGSQNLPVSRLREAHTAVFSQDGCCCPATPLNPAAAIVMPRAWAARTAAAAASNVRAPPPGRGADRSISAAPRDGGIAGGCGATTGTGGT